MARPNATIWLFFLLLFSSALIAHAQTPAIDQLKKQLTTEGQDTSRVKTLTKLSMMLRASDIIAAEKYASEAITLAKAISYPRGHAKALNAIAVINRVEGNPQKALRSLLKALEINKILSDTIGICQTLNGIGATYAEMNSYQDALEHFEQVLHLRETLKDTTAIAVSFSNIAEVFEKMGDYKQAVSYNQKSIDTDIAMGNTSATNYALHSLGRIHSHLKNWGLAKQYLLQALAIRKRMSFHYGVAETSIQLGLLYQQIGQEADALTYYQDALLDAKRANANTLHISALKGLADTHSALRQFEQASATYRQYIALNDSIFTVEKQRIFTELMAQYEADRKDKENLLLRKEKNLKEEHIEKQQSNIWFMALAIFVLIVLLTTGVVLYRNKRKTNFLLLNLNRELSQKQKEIMEQSQRLEEANEYISQLNLSLEAQVQERTQALEDSNKNLEMYLYRSAHDLRGPIASIQGLIKIAPMVNLIEYPEMFAKMDALTQNMLGILEKLNTLASLDDYTVEIVDWGVLLEEVKQKHQPHAIKKGLQWKITTPPEAGILTSDSRLIKQLLHCIIENAIQFSYPQESILISVEETPKFWLIKVMDKGIGMEDFIQEEAFNPYFRGNERSQGHGLGLYLAKRIIEKLSGEIKLYSIPKQGTTVEIKIPLALHQNISEGTSKVAQKR